MSDDARHGFRAPPVDQPESVGEDPASQQPRHEDHDDPGLPGPGRQRPGWDEYYMSIARAVSARSNCLRRQVGAIVVVGKSIISTGYNGAPMGVRNCDEGGCPRCASDARSGEGYDTCICVHAEQNAIVLAARHGNSTERGVLYTTLRPCFGCVKEAVQAGIGEIVFEEPLPYPDELEEVYRRLVAESGLKLRRYPEG